MLTYFQADLLELNSGKSSYLTVSQLKRVQESFVANAASTPTWQWLL